MSNINNTMKKFKDFLKEAAKKTKNSPIPPLDPRYGTPQDPRLDIHNDQAYKDSGSGTGIFKAGIGFSPGIGRPLTPEERGVGGTAPPPRKKPPIEEPHHVVKNFDAQFLPLSLDQIAKKMNIKKRQSVDWILQQALRKVLVGLRERGIKPSDYTPNISDIPNPSMGNKKNR